MKRATCSCSYWYCVRCGFQSTPSWRGRQDVKIMHDTNNLFQSTPSWRGRLLRQVWHGRQTAFQSTPSWRGRRLLNPKICISWRFQSTPSWRGRPKGGKIQLTATVISIHALVKRATYPNYRQGNLRLHFNPRPREEGDTRYTKQRHHKEDFNPRPREEGDVFTKARYNIDNISIHALVKRATL